MMRDGPESDEPIIYLLLAALWEDYTTMRVDELIILLQAMRQDAVVAIQANDGPCENIEKVVTYTDIPDIVYLVGREN